LLLLPCKQEAGDLLAAREHHLELLQRALEIEQNAEGNLISVKGLGRSFSWRVAIRTAIASSTPAQGFSRVLRDVVFLTGHPRWLRQRLLDRDLFVPLPCHLQLLACQSGSSRVVQSIGTATSD